MSVPTVGMQVAADGSDVVQVQYVQTNGTPTGASETLNVRGFPLDQQALINTLQVKNTQVGYLTGNH